MNVSGKLVILVGLLGGLSAGCHARVYGGARVHYVEHETVAYVDAPELVLVEDDIYVVQDSDYAVYYVDGYYWSYRGTGWYRTRYYNNPWVVVHVHSVPGRISARDHHHYVHYHGHAGARVWREPARPRSGREASSPHRDHDDHGSNPRSGHADINRDRNNRKVDANKVERRDDRREAKEERREEKVERRDDRRDAKDERRDDRRDAKQDAARNDGPARRDTSAAPNPAKPRQEQPKKAPPKKSSPTRSKKR